MEVVAIVPDELDGASPVAGGGDCKRVALGDTATQARDCVREGDMRSHLTPSYLYTLL